MMLFRRAQTSDLEAIYNLAIESGIGITTLLKDKELLLKRLQNAETAFQKKISAPENEYYLFVLEDTKNGCIAGTAAIEAALGFQSPFYSYRISRQTRLNHALKVRNDNYLLNLVNDNQGHSELCTLYLAPDYRIHHNGAFLSRARFLFMAQFPERFAAMVIAEMRGMANIEGTSPFWEGVGKHFFHMSFEEADRLTSATDKQFIADLMPENPIYIKLLPKDAQEVIGKPHPSSLPAMSILMKEGFEYKQYIDIFDAGPTLEAPFAQIKSINDSQLSTISNLSDEVSGQTFIIANTQLNFRATLSQIMQHDNQTHCIISKETAELLAVQQGDAVRLIALKGIEK